MGLLKHKTGGVFVAQTVESSGGSGGAATLGFQNPASPLNGSDVLFAAQVVDAVNNFALTANRLYYQIFVSPPSAITITDALIKVNTGVASSTLYYGVVQMDADWQPNATGLVGQSSVDASSAGNKRDTTPNWTLTGNTRYAFFYICNNAVTLGASKIHPYIGDGGARPITNDGSWAWGEIYAAGTAGAQSNPLPDATTVVAVNFNDGMRAPILVRYTA